MPSSWSTSHSLFTLKPAVIWFIVLTFHIARSNCNFSDFSNILHYSPTLPETVSFIDLCGTIFYLPFLFFFLLLGPSNSGISKGFVSGPLFTTFCHWKISLWFNYHLGSSTTWLRYRYFKLNRSNTEHPHLAHIPLYPPLYTKFKKLTPHTKITTNKTEMHIFFLLYFLSSWTSTSIYIVTQAVWNWNPFKLPPPITPLTSIWSILPSNLISSLSLMHFHFVNPAQDHITEL